MVSIDLSKVDAPQMVGRLVVETVVVEVGPILVARGFANGQDLLRQEHRAEDEKVLCAHCLRTATNGIKCKGICVADSEY